MRPFLWWMKSLGICHSWPSLRLLKVSGALFSALLVWRDPSFILRGVRMGVICHRQMIMTDASISGWGAVFKGPAYGVWSGKYLTWHINGLELRAVHQALTHFIPFLTHSHVIVRKDNMAVVSHINRQGGSRSHTLNRHTCQLLLWTQDKFLSLRAVHVPGVPNMSQTETQVRGMDAEPPYGGSDLGKIRRGRGELLCIDPMPPLVLPLSPCLSGDICASAPLAGHEAVCFPSGQAHPSSAGQGEDMRTPPSPCNPVLAFPDVVLGVNLPLGR